MNHTQEVEDAETQAHHAIDEDLHNATHDVNSMIEYCFRDEETNGRIQQDQIHIAIQQMIEHCISHGKRKILIMIPFGTGKTTQVLAWGLKEVGNNHNKRIKIVCNTDKNAKKRTGFCKNTIQKNKDFQRIFPDLKPDPTVSWGTFELTVQRDVIGKDPTIEACGILSSGTGSRADILIFDDICDYKNTVQMAAMKEDVGNAFKSVWMRRLDGKNGIAIAIATSWSKDDVIQSLRANDEWAQMIASISEDFTHFEVEYKNVPGITGIKYVKIPLWDKKFDEESYRSIYVEVGPKMYNLYYRNQPTSEEDYWFPSIGDCIVWDKTLDEVMPKNKKGEWKFDGYAGVDMSTSKRKGSAVITLLYNRKLDMRYVGLETIKIGKWKGPRLLAQIAAQFRIWNWRRLNAENNAAQDLIVDFIKEYKTDDGKQLKIPVKAFSTQAGNKHDLEIGIQSMDIEFNQGKWLFAGGDKKHPKGCGCGFCTLITQIQNAPQMQANDALMALWMASMCIKKRKGNFRIRTV